VKVIIFKYWFNTNKEEVGWEINGKIRDFIQSDPKLKHFYSGCQKEAHHTPKEFTADKENDEAKSLREETDGIDITLPLGEIARQATKILEKHRPKCENLPWEKFVVEKEE